MYNHYIPQSDGSYRRNSVPESSRRQPQKTQSPAHREPPKPEPKPEPDPSRPCPEPAKPVSPPTVAECARPQEGILSFLKGLLPRQIDTADLMILFLLLLMNKDEEDGLSPMLTLALYFLL